MQLRFTSFAVVSLRRDFHPQDCAHAGRTTKKAFVQTSAFLLSETYGRSDLLTADLNTPISQDPVDGLRERRCRHPAQILTNTSI